MRCTGVPQFCFRLSGIVGNSVFVAVVVDGLFPPKKRAENAACRATLLYLSALALCGGDIATPCVV